MKLFGIQWPDATTGKAHRSCGGTFAAKDLCDCARHCYVHTVTRTHSIECLCACLRPGKLARAQNSDIFTIIVMFNYREERGCSYG